MGDGKRKKNLKLAVSGANSSGFLTCPTRGSVPADVPGGNRAGGSGVLVASGGLVALVGESGEIATLNDARLLACVERGLHYRGVLRNEGAEWFCVFEEQNTG